jgi:hypothetical protein
MEATRSSETTADFQILNIEILQMHEIEQSTSDILRMTIDSVLLHSSPEYPVPFPPLCPPPPRLEIIGLVISPHVTH